VKIADPTGAPLDPAATAVWYSPTYHSPTNGLYTQFCGHGVGFAYRLKDLITPFFVSNLTNADLLDDPNVLFFSYHSVRWTSNGAQQIPTASAAKPSGLSRNRLGTGSPPVDLTFFTCNRSRSFLPVISMPHGFIGSDILVILAKITIATYYFQKGYTR
jgi:hypothetical protein